MLLTHFTEKIKKQAKEHYFFFPPPNIPTFFPYLLVSFCCKNDLLHLWTGTQLLLSPPRLCSCRNLLSLFLSLLSLLQYYVCLCFDFFGPEACGVLPPWPGIEPTPPALEDKVLPIYIPRIDHMLSHKASHGIKKNWNHIKHLPWSEDCEFLS